MDDWIDTEILEALGALHGIDALAVFGSRACGRSRPDSDLDVAVLTVDTNPAARRLKEGTIGDRSGHAVESLERTREHHR